jgi:molybdate transport system ATP-binding protein
VDEINKNTKFIEISILKNQTNFKLEIPNLKIPNQGVTAVFGPSGSGKTTFLRCLAGFESFEGRLSVNGQLWQNDQFFLKTHLRAIGYVFQEPSLFTHLNVQKNLEYAYSRIPEAAKKIKWDSVIKLLGLENLLRRSVHLLSGGEQQRVAMGRALLTSPELLLMDEPVSALDQKSKNEILFYLKKISEELHLPIFYVSHALDEIVKIADRMLLIENGKFLKLGSVEELLCQLDLSVLQGDMSSALLYGSIDHNETELGITCIICDGQKIYVPMVQVQSQDKIRIKITAKDVSITKVKPEATSILNILKAQVFEIKMQDQFQVLLKLKLNQQYILSKITKKSLLGLKLAPGDEVYVQIKSVGLFI